MAGRRERATARTWLLPSFFIANRGFEQPLLASIIRTSTPRKDSTGVERARTSSPSITGGGENGGDLLLTFLHLTIVQFAGLARHRLRFFFIEYSISPRHSDCRFNKMEYSIDELLPALFPRDSLPEKCPFYSVRFAKIGEVHCHQRGMDAPSLNSVSCNRIHELVRANPTLNSHGLYCSYQGMCVYTCSQLLWAC